MLRAHCEHLDSLDPLTALRRQFVWDEPQRLRFDGNSIGPMSLQARQAFDLVASQWRDQARFGWSRCGWFEAPLRMGDKLGVLLGAGEGQVVVCDSTSLNLHKALSLAMTARPGGGVVLMQAGGFPTDEYVAQGLCLPTSGFTLERLAGDEQALMARLARGGVAILCLSHTDYRSGERLDMARLCEQARQCGALTLFDLSHSAGAGALFLDDCGVDFAVGCGYKYLGGGPGAPGFLYVARRHQHLHRPAPWGWMGHENPLAFESDYKAHPGMRAHLVGTPGVIANVVMEAALDHWLGLDLAALWVRRAALAKTFIATLDALLPDTGLQLVTPREAQRQGGFLALRHPDAAALVERFEQAGLIISHRPPDVMRFAISPLVHRHVDVFDALVLLGAQMRGRTVPL